MSPGRQIFQWLNRRYAVREHVTLGARVHIGPGSVLWAPQHLVVERDVYIGKRCTIEADGIIRSGSLIANNVGVVGRRDHDFRQLGVPIRLARWVGDVESSDLRSAVDIGPDAWIGFGAVLLAPVHVGRGAIVAAGAIVTKDVPPYGIVAGNPARVVGWRLQAEDRELHERGVNAWLAGDS